MNPAEAEIEIRTRVAVTHQMVILAKAIAINAARSTCTADDLIGEVLKKNAINSPMQVVVHESVDMEATVKAVADSISWRLAACEAIWSLIHEGLLFALDTPSGSAPSISWTTVIPGSGGQSAGWRFEEFYLPVPRQLRRAPSANGGPNQFLAEPDLYLNSLGVVNMHPDVASAFYESVKCFRNELFTAALAMLGKASEGAWLELGSALIKFLPSQEEAKFLKQRSVLEDPMMGTVRKIDAVLQIFDHQEVFRAISKSSGVKLQDLRSVAVWSDAVRDSRNTIHFGVTPLTPNTYEKLAALLIGAVPYVRMLYSVKGAADGPP